MALKKRSKASSSTNTHKRTTTQSNRRQQQIDSGSPPPPPPPWAFTLPHLLALLHTIYAICLARIASFERGVREYQMGLTDWWTARQDQEGAERMALLERSDEGERSRRSPSVEKKEVKRRRHQPDQQDLEEAVFFPGMVNLSGTLCYMNSVLQAFASVTSLFTQLEKIVQLAVDVDLPTPVTDALLEVLYDLNTPQKRQPPALRPIALLHALQTLPAIRRLLSTREQQDAHELFLVLAEAVSDEALKVAAEVAQSRGLGEILSLQGYVTGKGEEVKVGQTRRTGDGGKETREKKRGLAMPWEGLMARRRVCKSCGWCESIRMDTLGGLELAIPLGGDVTVEQCVAQYLAPEALSEVTCEMCSLRQTLHYYTLESTRLSAPASTVTNGHVPGIHTKSGSFSALEHVLPNTNGIEVEGTMSANRKKKAKEATRVEGRLREMLESGTVTHFGENFLPTAGGGGSGVPVKWQTARTDSIREAAITRPPQSLRLHFIRSEYTPYGQLLKKNARVNFPLILDLTQFVANGVWEERNVLGMLNGSASTTTPSTSPPSPQQRVLYRLESVILHYGYNHSSGHYICIRRKPLPPPSDDAYRPVSVKKSCPDGCGCDQCRWFGQVRGETQTEVAGKGWLRISDADVDEVGVEELMAARSAVFMVFYEKVGEYDDSGKASAMVNGTGEGSSIAESASQA